jgi:DsbC/DsbD-like thiol-disulfide interchange protein
MKNVILFLIVILSAGAISSQTQNPVTWQANYKSISATEGEIIIIATIEKGWHTYSQKESSAGPIPTSFKFIPTKDFELLGKTEESQSHEEFVKAFDAKIFVFKDKAEFKQKLKTKKKGATITIKVDYMCCNDNMCLPPKTIELTIKTQ